MRPRLSPLIRFATRLLSAAVALFCLHLANAWWAGAYGEPSPEVLSHGFGARFRWGFPLYESASQARVLGVVMLVLASWAVYVTVFPEPPPPRPSK
jgi:hypothetical protein